jgi:hypothetical protein
MSMARTSANYIGPFSTNSLIPMYVGHTYVLNSDEGLTERALFFSSVQAAIKQKCPSLGELSYTTVSQSNEGTKMGC